MQQRLVDADYFQLVSVQPALDEKKDGKRADRRPAESR